MVSDQKDSGRKGDAMTNLRREIDTFLAGIRQDVVTALLAPLAWFLRLRRRRRDRKEYEYWREFVTRQGRMK